MGRARKLSFDGMNSHDGSSSPFSYSSRGTLPPVRTLQDIYNGKAQSSCRRSWVVTGLVWVIGGMFCLSSDMSLTFSVIRTASGELREPVRMYGDTGIEAADDSGELRRQRIACMVHMPANSNLKLVVEKAIGQLKKASHLQSISKDIVFVEEGRMKEDERDNSEKLIVSSYILLPRIRAVIFSGLQGSIREQVLYSAMRVSDLDCVGDVLMSEYALTSSDPPPQTPHKRRKNSLAPVSKDSGRQLQGSIGRQRLVRRLGLLDTVGYQLSRFANEAASTVSSQQPLLQPTVADNSSYADYEVRQYWDGLLNGEGAASAAYNSRRAPQKKSEDSRNDQEGELRSDTASPIPAPHGDGIGSVTSTMNTALNILGLESTPGGHGGRSDDSEQEVEGGALLPSFALPHPVGVANSILRDAGVDPDLLLTEDALPDPATILTNPSAMIPDLEELNYKAYVGAKKATAIMKELQEVKANGSNNPLVQFLSMVDSIGEAAQMVTPTPGSGNRPTGGSGGGGGYGNNYSGLDLSNLTQKQLQQLPSFANPEESQVLSAIMGAGFDTVLGAMGAQQMKYGQQGGRQQQVRNDRQAGVQARPVSDYQTADSLAQQIERQKSLLQRQNAIQAQIAQQQPTHQQLPSASVNLSRSQQLHLQKRLQIQQQQLALQQELLGRQPKLRRLQESTIPFDRALAYIAGCDCDKFSDGAACPAQQSHRVSVICESLAVWDPELEGALLSNVLRGLDFAVEKRIQSIMMPLWFREFKNPREARQATRIITAALQRAAGYGMIVAIAAGDRGMVGDSSDELHPLACNDLPGMAVLCASAADDTGSIANFANVPPKETVFAIGNNIPVDGAAVSGTGAALAQAFGVANMVRGITGSSAAPHEVVGMVYNPVRRMLLANKTDKYTVNNEKEQAAGEFVAQGGALDSARAVSNALLFTGQLPKQVMESGGCYELNASLDGDVVGSLKHASAVDCQKSCAIKPSCTFFSYRPAPDYGCTMYSTVTRPVNSPDTLYGPKVCPSSQVLEAVVQNNLESSLAAASSAVQPGAATPLSSWLSERSSPSISSVKTNPLSAISSGGESLLSVIGLGVGLTTPSTSSSEDGEVLDGQQAPSLAAAAGSLLGLSGVTAAGQAAASAAGGSASLLQTTQAVLEAGTVLMDALPIRQVWTAGQALHNSEFFRNRGIKAFAGPGLGVEKHQVLPPPGVGKPTVLCFKEGMTCCVPQRAISDWKNEPPHLNGELSPQCAGTFVTKQQAMCATSSFRGDNCGLTKTETADYFIFQNIFTIPGRTMNNAICMCRESKTPDELGERSVDGSAEWEFSMQAVTSVDEKDSKRGDKIANGLGTALVFTQMVSERGSTAITGTGEMINQYPPASKSHDIVAGVPGLTKQQPSNGNFFSSLAQGAQILGSAGRQVQQRQVGLGPSVRMLRNRVFRRKLSSAVPKHKCFTPWPVECKAWKSECEENSNLDGLSSKCQPVDLIELGCPKEELLFKVNDQQPGLISFSFRPLMFSGNLPYRLGCSYKVMPCEQASVDYLCSSRNTLKSADELDESYQRPAVMNNSINDVATEMLIGTLMGSSLGGLATASLNALSAYTEMGRKCTVATFNGEGQTVVESWTDIKTGRSIDAGKVIGYASSFTDEELEGCDRVDLEEFRFSSKMEILPMYSDESEGALLLDKYQRNRDGSQIELVMSSVKPSVYTTSQTTKPNEPQYKPREPMLVTFRPPTLLPERDSALSGLHTETDVFLTPPGKEVLSSAPENQASQHLPAASPPTQATLGDGELSSDLSDRSNGQIYQATKKDEDGIAPSESREGGTSVKMNTDSRDVLKVSTPPSSIESQYEGNSSNSCGKNQSWFVTLTAIAMGFICFLV
eukprot:GHVQ01013212.1.p1 GENE.GHVQ01013212.1~~GHVQ01013212.1.p1  ORF type:complete len:1868 (+),score=269.17 GHVQ01013212.1:456-6059(+)